MAGTITLLERAREYVARFAEQNDEPEGGGCRSLLAEIDARTQPFKRQEEPVGPSRSRRLRCGKRGHDGRPRVLRRPAGRPHRSRSDRAAARHRVVT